MGLPRESVTMTPAYPKGPADAHQRLPRPSTLMPSVASHPVGDHVEEDATADESILFYAESMNSVVARYRWKFSRRGPAAGDVTVRQSGKKARPFGLGTSDSSSTRSRRPLGSHR